MNAATQIQIIQSVLGKSKSKNHTGRSKPRLVNRMVWTIKDERLALDLYLKGAVAAEIERACVEHGIKLNSMKMKLSNISYLDGKGGLENVSDTTRALFLKRIA